MRALQFIRVLIFVLAVVPLVGGQTIQAPEGESDEWTPVFPVEEYPADWVTADMDENGRVDWAVELDEFGDKAHEAMDFNHDGMMDDFYFYSNDVLQREELDTNYDGAIDLWIHMYRGVWVRSYERDSDYDGEIDIVKDFGEE